MNFWYRIPSSKQEELMGDAQIVDKVLTGDAASYELLIMKHQSKLFATVLYIVKNRELAGFREA